MSGRLGRSNGRGVVRRWRSRIVKEQRLGLPRRLGVMIVAAKGNDHRFEPGPRATLSPHHVIDPGHAG